MQDVAEKEDEKKGAELRGMMVDGLSEFGSEELRNWKSLHASITTSISSPIYQLYNPPSYILHSFNNPESIPQTHHPTKKHPCRQVDTPPQYFSLFANVNIHCAYK